MSLVRSILAIVISLVVFYVGFKTGGTNSAKLNEQQLALCPTALTRVSVQTEPVVKEDKAEDDIPCPSNNLPFQSMCPSFSTNNLAKLHLGKATAPETIFPHLKHPSTPAKWNWYLSHSQHWEANKPGDNDHCDQMYLTRTGKKNQSLIE
jgi:hypothetical protein